eukprot:1175043-Ditylum_brightwellii.AAC.1
MLSGMKRPAIGINNDIALVQPLNVHCTAEERKKWTADHSLPQSFVDLLESIKELVKSLVTFIIASEATQDKRKDIINNINARLT